MDGSQPAISVIFSELSTLLIWVVLFIPGYVSFYLAYKIGKFRAELRGRVVFAISLTASVLSLSLSIIILHTLGHMFLPGDFSIFLIEDPNTERLLIWSSSVYLLHILIMIIIGLLAGYLIASRRDKTVVHQRAWDIFTDRHSFSKNINNEIQVVTQSGERISGSVSEFSAGTPEEGIILEDDPYKIVVRDGQENKEDIGDEAYVPGYAISYIWVEDDEI
jgi:hypothetical protein